MKKYILILLIIFELVMIKIPRYIELNNISIVENLEIIKKEDDYFMKIKEILPTRSSDGIKYQYKEYRTVSKSIERGIVDLEIKCKKKLYLKKIKNIKTNIDNIDDILVKLDIKSKKISYHK